MIATALIWGLPLARMTRPEAANAVLDLIKAGRPSFFITANVHYAMLTAEHPDLRALNDRAAFLLADGAPLVWASKRSATPLPERVAGSDLIYDLCERAAAANRSVYLLGGAARKLKALYPGLRVVGTACPGPADLAGEGGLRTVEAIRQAAPDLLFVAFGQPKGELWIDANLEALGVPAVVQVGATLDFIAGRVQRAPRLFQKVGLEWAFRIYTDPRRLAPRYARNAIFLFWNVTRELIQGTASGDGLEAKAAASMPTSIEHSAGDVRS
jgi:N-acetylglucosaminyldiphosphoundecaprenol N-acetyl-beta-D-mannosaminyltransferase